MSSAGVLMFGDVLRQARKAAGLTQEELAERARVAPETVSALERGVNRAPHRDTVEALGDALGLADGERLMSAVRRPLTETPDAVGLDTAGAENPRAGSSLPVALTRLLGRECEEAAIGMLLRDARVRLLTLVGPPGIGKTRLALAVATALEVTRKPFPDGVWWMPLASLTEPSPVVSSMVAALGLRDLSGSAPDDRLRVYLARKRLLLVLDNFEQVVAAAPLMADLLASSPQLGLLVTSREALRLQGEHEYPLSPLALPVVPSALAPSARTLVPLSCTGDAALTDDEVATLARAPAVALFVERARAVRPDFTLSPTNAGAVAQICLRVDGLPLAIELAAAHLKLFPPRALLARLSSPLALLAGGPRELPAHQRTLYETIAWSCALLSPDEQMLFRRLAVFAGGCTVEAAEAVCAALEGAEPLGTDVLDGPSALVDQSLLQLCEDEGEPRFVTLHVIHEYALERLEASGETEALRQAHAAYYLALAERMEGELHGPHQRAWLARMEVDQDNLRAVLGWAFDRGEAEVGGAPRLGAGSVLGLSRPCARRATLERCVPRVGHGRACWSWVGRRGLGQYAHRSGTGENIDLRGHIRIPSWILLVNAISSDS
jgi:predicted ATPase/DNA-binding XRE family transcriptional regulator